MQEVKFLLRRYQSSLKKEQVIKHRKGELMLKSVTVLPPLAHGAPVQCCPKNHDEVGHATFQLSALIIL